MTLVYLAVAWLTGIALAKTTSLPWQVLPVLGLAALLGLVLWRDDQRVRLCADRRRRQPWSRYNRDTNPTRRGGLWWWLLSRRGAAVDIGRNRWYTGHCPKTSPIER